jgi:hypothetical protein
MAVGRRSGRGRRTSVRGRAGTADSGARGRQRDAVRLVSGSIGESPRPEGPPRRRGLVHRGRRDVEAGWWPTRRARCQISAVTRRETRSREVAGAPRDAPRAVPRASTRNRPPIGTRATRDASSRPPPAASRAQACGSGARSALMLSSIGIVRSRRSRTAACKKMGEGSANTFSEEKAKASKETLSTRVVFVDD